MRRVLAWAALLAGLAAPVSAAGQTCEAHPVPPYHGMAEAFPINLDFGVDSTVVSVFVVVHIGFTRPWVASQLALDITITSLDGIDHFHGTDVVPLADTTVEDVENDAVSLGVPWTVDEEPEVVGDVYTVCVQLVAGATSLGPELCTIFGPFF